MVLNSLFPVFALIVLGVALKRWRLTTTDFLKASDRLVYYIFFPILLFWKIGGSPSSAGGSGRFYLAVILAVMLIYLLSLAYIAWRVKAFQAGAFHQSCFRFNTYIGMAVILTSLGEGSVRPFGILVGFLIPLNNVLSVATLSWFAEGSLKGRMRILIAARAMISNPLILACVSGVIYSRFVGFFPPFIESGLALMGGMTLPLALLSIGGSLEPTGIRDHLELALVSAGFKLLMLPLVGWLLMRSMDIGGIEMQIGMIYFALPISPGTYVLSSQLNSDSRLAATTIVLSTALSIIPLAVVLAVFG